MVDEPRRNRSKRIGFDSVLVLCFFLIIASWFTTSLLSPRATALLALGTLLALAVRRRHSVAAWRPKASTIVVCGLGLLLRAPALVEPAGFVGADGSLQAILTNVILNGARPAPVFLETSSYQGSLKAHIGAAASVVVGRDDLGLLVVIASVALWTMFTACTMALGRRLAGPDFYLAGAEAAPGLSRRLDHLGVSYQSEGTSLRLFYHLSRRVPLSEIQE